MKKIKLLFLIAIFVFTIESVQAYGMCEVENEAFEWARFEFCKEVRVETYLRRELNPYEEVMCRDVVPFLEREEQRLDPRNSFGNGYYGTSFSERGVFIY